MSQFPNLKLNDGKEIPTLGYGLGTANYKDSTKPIDQKLVDTVVMAIQSGYYHLDGAEVYGNEAELGLAIRASGVPRSQLFVTTKISGTAIQDTEAAFQLSLKKLQLDYVDLYLIHAPFFAKTPEDLQAKWADMEAIYASGRAKSIGVSNYRQKDLEVTLQTAKVVPAINQIEFHPYLQHGTLLSYSQEKGIATAAYAGLTAITKARPGPCDAVYAELAKKYGVNEGLVALRWGLDQGVVMVTTSGSKDRLEGYKGVYDFKLTPEEVDRIKVEGEKKHFRGFWNHKIDGDDRT